MTSTSPHSQDSPHLKDTVLLAVVFDQQALSAADRSHLDGCALCQQQLATLQQLADELQIAKASEPSAAATARYLALFETVQVQAAAPLAKLAEQVANLADAVRAAVMWNGRERLAMQGVRSAAATSYRMLYSTEHAEVELMVEPVAGQFKVEGELLPLTNEREALPVYLELFAQQAAGADYVPIYTGESDQEGRFHIPPMPAGAYSLHLVPPKGRALLIDALELA